ncbi:MAG: hypothetical protein WA761_02430 [Thermoplasmata archaeon]
MEASDLSHRLGEFYVAASEVLRDVKGITEQQIKHWIVGPFLMCLGWDPHDKRQVYLDFPVQPDGLHADYALLGSEGRPRLIIEVAKPGESGRDIKASAEKARTVGAPLLLMTTGVEFALYYVEGDSSETPLFGLSLKELAQNADALMGLTVEYRLSDTGINELRKSAIRMAVLQMLEDNSEKTFDAMVGWVQSQVAPGALDDTTDHAIREATMIWLTEEHFALPAFAGQEKGGRPNDLRATTARDWDPYPRGPAGAFQYKFDTRKTLDLRQSAKEVREALRLQGLRTPSATSFGGFYYALRRRAGLGAKDN